MNRLPGLLDDKEEKGQPKVLTGNIRLPQVFNHGFQAKDFSRMSYNFKHIVGEIGLDRHMDNTDGSESHFLNIIKRPKMYGKIESVLMSSKLATSTLEPDVKVETPVKVDREEPIKKSRPSKSRSRPISLDRASSK